MNQVELLGSLKELECDVIISRSRFIIVPSVCYENFPTVIVKAFSSGIPVIGSNQGSIKEIIEDGKTGLLFDPEDNNDLINKIEKLFLDESLLMDLKKNAFIEYAQKYTPEKNYQQLKQIYESVMM